MKIMGVNKTVIYTAYNKTRIHSFAVMLAFLLLTPI